jgi:hypothetical protein
MRSACRCNWPNRAAENRGHAVAAIQRATASNAQWFPCSMYARYILRCMAATVAKEATYVPSAHRSLPRLQLFGGD